MRYLWCRHLHQPGGWRSPAVLAVDADGRITEVLDHAPAEAEVQRLDGLVIPGFPNLHSHAFQRALAGLTEHSDPASEDSFWTWRDRMYRLALAITPEDIEVIAEELYIEMLEAGMTSVGEFHYLHHDHDGRAYADRTEMSLRIFAAAERAGIALTHLPVLYARGGFGVPALPEQRRFVHETADDFLRLFEALIPIAPSGVRLGVAPHSLRAVPPEMLRAALAGASATDALAPIHIHVAEQPREVEEANAKLGAPPVAWLLDHAEVDARWCLVHATHADEAEILRVAKSGAAIGLCPTTEANLGDGIFPAERYLEVGGHFGVGSDSHVSISATEELRLLEYTQRLGAQKRNRLFDRSSGEWHVGRALFDRAVEGGARALGQPTGILVPGRRADLVLLDPAHPRLAGHSLATALDAWIFGGADRAIREVWVAGVCRVADGRHPLAEATSRRYAATVSRLLAKL